MNFIKRGFICCDVMPLVAILSPFALPAYEDFEVRVKVQESMAVAASVQALFATHHATDSLEGLNQVAAVLNATPAEQKGARYVADVCVGGTTCAGMAGEPWHVYMVFKATPENGLPRRLNGKTLVFSPNVNGEVPKVGATGSLTWACASTSSRFAAAQGLENRGLGTLPAKYAPKDCR